MSNFSLEPLLQGKFCNKSLQNITSRLHTLINKHHKIKYPQNFSLNVKIRGYKSWEAMVYVTRSVSMFAQIIPSRIFINTFYYEGDFQFHKLYMILRLRILLVDNLLHFHCKINFLSKNHYMKIIIFAKDCNTLIEQSILQIMKYFNTKNILHEIF